MAMCVFLFLGNTEIRQNTSVQLKIGMDVCEQQMLACSIVKLRYNAPRKQKKESTNIFFRTCK